MLSNYLRRCTADLAGQINRSGKLLDVLCNGKTGKSLGKPVVKYENGFLPRSLIKVATANSKVLCKEK